MNQSNPGWRSLLTKEIIVKVLVPLSALAFLTGTSPTDTAVLAYLQQAHGFTGDTAVAAVSIRTYSPIAFTVPVMVFVLSCGTRYAMISGAISYLLFLAFFIQQAVPELTLLGCVFAGYAATTWIACCCCGRYVLKDDCYVFYYACIACCHLVGHLVSTILDGLVLESIIGVPTLFYLALGTGTYSLAISFFWIPTQQYVYTPQGPVDIEVSVVWRAHCPWIRQDWPRLGYALVPAMKIRVLRRLVVWYMLTYAVYLSIESHIADYLTSGGAGLFEPTLGLYLLATLMTCAAIATASTVLVRMAMHRVKVEQVITLASLLSNLPFMILQLLKQWPSAYVTASVVLILLGNLQLTLAVVKIATDVPAEVNVVLYGALWLASIPIKALLTSLVPQNLQAIVFALIWFFVGFVYALPAIFGCQYVQVVPQVAVVVSRTGELKDNAEHSISVTPQNDISVVSEVQ